MSHNEITDQIFARIGCCGMARLRLGESVAGMTGRDISAGERRQTWILDDGRAIEVTWNEGRGVAAIGVRAPVYRCPAPDTDRRPLSC
jgi:hypothetical protein